MFSARLGAKVLAPKRNTQLSPGHSNLREEPQQSVIAPFKKVIGDEIAQLYSPSKLSKGPD
jgi:hypothetical protein